MTKHSFALGAGNSVQSLAVRQVPKGLWQQTLRSALWSGMILHTKMTVLPCLIYDVLAATEEESEGR